jgi:ribosomal protein S12 methylthiotransferase accessory factor
VGNGGKLEDLVSPITGIVRKVETTPQPVVGLFHSQAHFVHALPVGRIRPLLKPQVGIGKGFSALNARTTAIAEAVERHSLVFRGDEHRILARVDELDAIHPQMLLHFSEKQYSNRAVWNTLHSEFQRVPDPFEDDKAIEWSPATDLSTKEVRYVPTAYCYMWYASSSAPSSFCNADTNGCAAGATRDEALQNGLLELVERDAVAIWWYNQLQRHAVDLKSFGDPSLLSLRENLTCAGRDLQILDLTTDLGIPVYAAVIAKRDGSQPCFGCAAHLSPRTAALKAACEASQILFWTGQQTQADEMTRFLDSATLERNSYLRVRETRPAPPEPGLNIQESLDYSVSRIVNAGIRPLWADLTRADIGVPVVRVIAPGLRHVWARFAPGRLYDVPVQQGWLNRPKTEDELNPLPCML